MNAVHRRHGRAVGICFVGINMLSDRALPPRRPKGAVMADGVALRAGNMERLRVWLLSELAGIHFPRPLPALLSRAGAHSAPIPIAMTGLLIIVTLVLVAAFAPLLHPGRPATDGSHLSELGNLLRPPGADALVRHRRVGPGHLRTHHLGNSRVTLYIVGLVGGHGGADRAFDRHGGRLRRRLGRQRADAASPTSSWRSRG